MEEPQITVGILSGKEIDCLKKGEDCDVAIDGREYTVYCRSTGEGAVCEFIENTYYKQITREYLASKPCVAIAVFDNAEDFSDNSDESFSEAMLDIEVCLQKWAEQYSALYKKIGNNRYMIIFRDADVEKMAADKFPILKTIRGITINNHSASISVGLCRGYNNIKESELNARKAVLKAELQKAQREERDYAAMRRNVEDFLSPVSDCCEVISFFSSG